MLSFCSETPFLTLDDLTEEELEGGLGQIGSSRKITNSLLIQDCETARTSAENEGNMTCTLKRTSNFC